MNDILATAKHDLLDPSGLTDNQLQNIIYQLAGPHIDYADLYFQSSYTEAWVLENGIIKNGSFDIDRGVGVRAMSGEKTGFAYADDILLPALQQATLAARSIVKQGREQSIQAWHKSQGHQLYQPINPLYSLSEQEKISLMQKVENYIRQKDNRIVHVNVSLAGNYETLFVMDNKGNIAGDLRPLVRFNVSLIIEHQGRRESGYAGGGGRYDYHYFLKNDLAFHFADQALRQALINLEAVDAPAGPMTVVLGSGWPGVLLHEAVGHGLEGDFNRKGISTYRTQLGLSPIPSPDDAYPLIPKIRGKGAIYGVRHIRKIVQHCFDRAVERLNNHGFTEDATILSAATVHWLRHTGISEDVKIRPREHVRDDAGHSSSAITDQYIDIELRARHASAKKKPIKVE